MSASRTKLIVLDLDGPVLDGRERHYQCYRDILIESKCDPLEIDVYWELKRNKSSLAAQLELSGATVLRDSFLPCWLDRIELPKYLALDRVQPFVSDTLARLESQGIPVVLLTMRNHADHLYQQLENLELSKFFSEVVAVKSEKGVESKLSAAARLLSKFDPGELLWVGDTEADVLPAQALKIPVCAIESGLRNREYLSSLKPDFIIRSMAELYDVIQT